MKSNYNKINKEKIMKYKALIGSLKFSVAEAATAFEAPTAPVAPFGFVFLGLPGFPLVFATLVLTPPALQLL